VSKVDAAADLALQRGLANTWPHGWLPYDLFRYIGRTNLVTSLLVDAIASENAQYSTVHPRWQAQLSSIGAEIWWSPDSPHLGQWAARHNQPRSQALLTVVQLLASLMSLNKLPQILPLPGTAWAGAAHAAVDQKVLTRVRGLLAKAESTQFPDEAEALSAKAQELMNRHAFDRALLDASNHVPQSAASRRLWLDNPYINPKAQLVHVIADANRCRAVFHNGIGFVSLVGDELDLEITELLSTSLLVQATRAMVAEGPTRTGQSRIRSYRHAFLLAYATRISERLHAANEPNDDDRLLPVLADRRQAVDSLFATMFTSTVTKSVSVTNGAGWHAGRAAADRANLSIERRTVPDAEA
jgi:hypothetical protein